MDFSKCVKSVGYRLRRKRYKLNCVYGHHSGAGISLKLVLEKNENNLTYVIFVSRSLDGLKKNEIAVDTYRNRGIYVFLREEKVVLPAHRHIRKGYRTYPICYLMKHDKEKKGDK